MGTGLFPADPSHVRRPEPAPLRASRWEADSGDAHAEVLTFPGTGQIRHITCPDTYADAFIAFVRRHPELYRIIEEAQFVAEDVYRQHYLTFVEGYGRNLAAARARGEVSDGPDELRAWALIGMSVFLGMRYGIWNRDRTPEEVADLAIDFVSEGLRKR